MTAVAQTPAAPSAAGERRAVAARLTQSGRFEESLPLWRDELYSGEDGAGWVRAAAVEAMAWRDLTVAGRLAELYAAARWGSRWYPGPATAAPIARRPPRTQLSVPKLRHDIDQFRHLRDRGLLGAEFDEIIGAYAELAERLLPAGIEARVPLAGEHEARIGHVYNRIVHLAPAPRVDRALSSTWDPVAVEDRYLSEAPGLVVIDDFLSSTALAQVRRFCLESTVWSGTRYAAGRLGAFFVDGFAAPLLLQIAEELRAAFPRMIGERHPLRQLWGFKNAPSVAGPPNLHADFAAVNVNFWVTPTEANLDEDTGGLVVHDVPAPLSWDFTTYNERPELIAGYLRNRGARAFRVPYRANRAIIFNSDLFHATEPIRFRPEYEHRRVNITMLYGDRADDRHHPSPVGAATNTGTPAWRSGALGRARG
ncbi:MAG TPA: hypothetical protein VGD67_21890 [Pseudonocardiaceae bacterium]